MRPNFPKNRSPRKFVFEFWCLRCYIHNCQSVFVYHRLYIHKSLHKRTMRPNFPKNRSRKNALAF